MTNPLVPRPAYLAEQFHLWAFNESFGHGDNNPEARIKLHNAEHDELIEALQADALRQYDPIEYLSRVAHELGDNVLVAYGSAHSLGIPLDAVIYILYKSLLTRVTDDGHPAVDENNKVRKTLNYQSPRDEIRSLIEQTLRERTRKS